MHDFNLYAYTDKSKLFKAWKKHYEPMKLGNMKLIKVVRRKVNKGKMPQKEL